VEELIALIIERVQDHSGVELRTEVVRPVPVSPRVQDVD
jgi:UDP-N-acetylenolpyruvoylglucosamine reductase